MAPEWKRDKSPIIARAIELSFAIICTGLIVDPFNNKMETNMNHAGLAYVTFTGFILINTVRLLSDVVGDGLPKRVQLLLAIAGGSLFVAAGGVVLDGWSRMYYNYPTNATHFSKQYLDMMIASGIIAEFNAAVFFVELGLTLAYT